MTEKQQQILKSALELFAKEGFHATSTSKVAKHAGVSEGLIFRHFGNKDGLLQAILFEGEQRLKTLFVDIVMETNPDIVIRKTIEMTGNIHPDDYVFWKLQFKLKWELEVNSDQKMEPLRMALINAFRKRKEANPEMEAETMLLIIEGLSSSVLKGSQINMDHMIQFLLKKYQV